MTHVEPPSGESFSPDTDLSGARGDLASDVAFVLKVTNAEAREWIADHGQQAAEERVVDYWGDGE